MSLNDHVATAESVSINGHTYFLHGADCDRLKALIPELTSPEGIKSLELTERLWSLEARNIKLVDQVE